MPHVLNTLSTDNKSASIAPWRDEILEHQLGLKFKVALNVESAEIHNPYFLYREETEYIKKAIPRRRAEFSTGREIARNLLTRINNNRVAIPVGSKGEPIWPSNVVGSITHDGDYAMAVVSEDPGIKGIGIDLLCLNRVIKPLPSYLVCNDADNNALQLWLTNNTIAPFEDIDSTLLLFTLKESVVKVISPSLDHYVELMDIRIILNNGQLLAHYDQYDRPIHLYLNFYPPFMFSFAISLMS